MDCIVITIVWTIAGVNAPTWYKATHNHRNSSGNSSCLKNRRCENSLTFTKCNVYSSYGLHTPRRSWRVRRNSTTGLTWFHVPMNFIGPNTGQGIRIYHDGVEGGRRSVLYYTGRRFFASDGIAVGKSSGTYASFDIDELSFYDHALSPAEITKLSQSSN